MYRRIGFAVGIGTMIMYVILTTFMITQLINMIDNLYINSEDFQYFMKNGIIKLR